MSDFYTVYTCIHNYIQVLLLQDKLLNPVFVCIAFIVLAQLMAL